MGASTTLAAVMTKPLETEVRELPVPDVGPDDGILRVIVNGICSSDWLQYNREAPGPRILGHEMVGTIEKIGKAAAYRWGVKEGDLVALEEYLPCGHCEYCRSGEIRSCLETDQTRPGAIRYGSTALSVAPSLWGGYSRFVYMPPRTVIHKVPEGVPPHIAAMCLPIGNGFQWAFLDGGAGPGKTVVIQGPGQQGLGCVLAAAVAGADQIIVSGLSHDTERFTLAKALGAHHTVAVDQVDLLEAVSELTNGRMADLVIDTSGVGPSNTNPSLQLLRKRSTMLAISRKGAVANFDMDRVIANQLNVRGTRGHSYAAVELALKAMASGRYPIELMSTQVMALGDVDHAIRTMGGKTGERAIHISIDPWR
ncbi:MAG: hypothetical protein RLZ98_1446 [Pseudomonadota bacterium]|jgi:threonine dehydrogenase-like Zn-dependent dehydrogenase